MASIRILYRPEMPLPSDYVNGTIRGSDLACDAPASDNEVIRCQWQQVLAENPRCYSKPGGLGSLVDSTDPRSLVFRPTEFMHYVGVSRSWDEGRTLSHETYDAMRVGAIGAALTLANGDVLLHKRPEHSSHVRGKMDASVTGFCHVDSYGSLDFRLALFEKLSRELKLTDADFDSITTTGIQSSGPADFSGMVSYALSTRLEPGHIKERTDPTYFTGIVFVPRDRLADYVVEHFGRIGDLIGDGASTLLQCLPYDEFKDAVERINTDRPA